MSNNNETIDSLPGELIDKIFQNMSYADLAKVRPVCKRFNNASRYVMVQVLHEIRKNLDRMLDKFVTAEWFRKIKKDKSNYIIRLRKGASSLMMLSVVLGTFDALTFHFIHAGILPPLPAEFLEKAQRAVKFATNRNPLVGKSRIKMILVDMFNYISANMITREIPFSSTTVFKTIVDLLSGFCKESETLEKTDVGWHYKMCSMNVSEDDEGIIYEETVVNATKPILLVALQRTVWLSPDEENVKLISSSNFDRFYFANVQLTEAEITVVGQSEEVYHANVESLLHVVPKAFSVKLFCRVMDTKSSLVKHICYIFDSDDQRCVSLKQ